MVAAMCVEEEGGTRSDEFGRRGEEAGEGG
jgi:hypothetical protein